MNNTQAALFLLLIFGLLYSGRTIRRIIRAARYLWWACVSSSHRFRIRDNLESLPTCHIRLLTERDYGSCKAIYQVNEAGHFPVGYDGLFAEWLTSGKSLVVVIETDGRVVAFGGINAMQRKWLNLASLTFGMVHPDHHRKGFGTILLFARLALLPRTLLPWQVMLSPGLTSGSFYSQFGFRFLSRDRDPCGRQVDTFAAALRPAQRAAFDRAFSAISISPEVRRAVIPPVTALATEPKTNGIPENGNPNPETHFNPSASPHVSDRQR
jgi:GNAT superfamily N-acetyltransferase